jgi:hypothetical protein
VIVLGLLAEAISARVVLSPQAEAAERLATEGEILAHLIRRDLDQVAAMYAGEPAVRAGAA